jgi:hypothetical protein
VPDQLLGDLGTVDRFLGRVMEDMQADEAAEEVPGDRVAMMSPWDVGSRLL